MNYVHNKVLSEEVRQINGKIRIIFAAWIPCIAQLKAELLSVFY